METPRKFITANNLFADLLQTVRFYTCTFINIIHPLWMYTQRNFLCQTITSRITYSVFIFHVFFLQMVAMSSIWEKTTTVIVFLRRFGWQLCRLWSTELSEIKPQLDANNVTLAGIGLEDLGLDEFVKGEYFKGGWFKYRESFIQGKLTSSSIQVVNIWAYSFVNSLFDCKNFL